MSVKKQKLIAYFKAQGGIARYSSILRAGFHRDTFYTLKKEGKIMKVTRGIYRLAQFDMGPNPDLIIVSMRIPNAVVCLISALAYHDATDEIPHKVEVAISPKSWTNKIDYPPIKFYRFSDESWKAGVEQHDIGGQRIKIYSLEKTIADCFKFRNRIGINVAREALKISVSEKGAKPRDIMKYSRICRVDKIVKPILESVL